MARRYTALIVCLVALACLATTASGASSFKSSVFASGAGIFHTTPKGREAISFPDDITSLGGDIYVAFQNGVGPQGQASTTGNLDSTVVEFDAAGHAVGQWDLAGKCDGLTAEPQIGQVIATINEDAHSSLYLIKPGGTAVHYAYSRPLPSKGGTDAISVYHGLVLISGSAPGTTGAAAPQARYPAVYRATFNTTAHTVTMRSLFGDEARAVVANTGADRGQRVRLALTDPDSNEDVPAYARRFAGDFMLTSQGDQEQIFVSGAGRAHQSLSVLKLTHSVDDTAWPSGPTGALYTTDNSGDKIYKITGSFARGSELAAVTPCDQNNAPSTCPGPGFPANFLGEINPNTGAIVRVALSGPAVQPQGMLFLAP
ncbi:MAG TPA: hypothetical protein VMA76_03440 [Solirubrobacteraceae bacterium]|nr:hypothetical protein [Solirubrobacteraceae bacterium]